LKVVKVPSPTRLLCGGALAYWLSHIINPAFVAIAVMIVLFIPIFVTDYFSDQLVEAHIPEPLPQPHYSEHQLVQAPDEHKLLLPGKSPSLGLLHSDDESKAEDKTAYSQKIILTR
jgi:hypothetical protein